MDLHTFDFERADQLEDPTRFRFCSREELLQYLDVDQEATVLDLGSGTGFYTGEIAPHVGSVYGLDVQGSMHAFYREKGTPDNVDLVTAEAELLPLRNGAVDAAVTTMTFHEVATDHALADLHRVIAPGGRFVAVDWSEAGRGEAGPPRDERFDAATAGALLTEAGFTVESSIERAETFVVTAEV